MGYNWGYSPFTKCLLTFWDILVKPFFPHFVTKVTIECYHGGALAAGGRNVKNESLICSDLTRPHPKWWFTKGNFLFISGKSALVKYYNLAR